jgi:hypothetical protein
MQIRCKTDQAHYAAPVGCIALCFFLLRWIVSESSLGLFLLIGFITVKGSGMRGKSSVIRVRRYLLLPPIERKPRPSDALEQ